MPTYEKVSNLSLLLTLGLCAVSNYPTDSEHSSHTYTYVKPSVHVSAKHF